MRLNKYKIYVVGIGKMVIYLTATALGIYALLDVLGI